MHILDTLEQCHLSKIRHYCNRSMNFIMAVENPMVASILPLTLGSAPGEDPTVGALRLSLLGVASVPPVVPPLPDPGVL